LLAPELSGKRLQLLKEVQPKATRVAIVWNVSNVAASRYLAESRAAARSLGLEIQSVEVRAPSDLNAAFDTVTAARPSACMTLPDGMLLAHASRIVDFAARARIPALFPDSEFATAGGLMAYGPSLAASFGQAATYVVKILKGAHPANLTDEILKQYPTLRVTRLHDMLRDRGFKGAVRTLRQCLAAVRPTPKREAFLRLQPQIGEQAQIDWAYVGDAAVGGGNRPLWLFVIVLSWSRAMWGELVYDLGASSPSRPPVLNLPQYQPLPLPQVFALSLPLPHAATPPLPHSVPDSAHAQSRFRRSVAHRRARARAARHPGTTSCRRRR
jgi:hypothetical protein